MCIKEILEREQYANEERHLAETKGKDICNIAETWIMNTEQQKRLERTGIRMFRLMSRTSKNERKEGKLWIVDNNKDGTH